MKQTEIEKKAEKYIESKSWNWEQNQVMGDEIKQAYLDGVKQGYEDCRHYAHDYYKPKWHDLRKNPDDLPKENGKYIIHIKVSEIMTVTDTCDFFNGYFGQYIKPIAWCELPIFKEN